jgi:hypothetical protein
MGGRKKEIKKERTKRTRKEKKIGDDVNVHANSWRNGSPCEKFVAF